MSLPERIEVREASDLESAQELWAAGRDAAEEWMVCAPGVSPHPHLDMIQRWMPREGVRIYGAWDEEGAPLAYAVVHVENDGHMWFVPCIPWADACPAGDEAGSVYAQVGLKVVEDCGACWGIVESADLRALLLAVSGRVHMDPRRPERLEFRDGLRAGWPVASPPSGEGVPS